MLFLFFFPTTFAVFRFLSVYTFNCKYDSIIYNNFRRALEFAINIRHVANFMNLLIFF